MPASLADLKTMLPSEVGDTGIVAINIDTIFALYDDLGDVGLQYLYAKKHAYKMLAGQKWAAVDTVSGDMREYLSQQAERLESLANGMDVEIADFVSSGNAVAPASGDLIQTAPIMVGQAQRAPLYPPDANAQVYRGSPYVPARFPR